MVRHWRGMVALWFGAALLALLGTRRATAQESADEPLAPAIGAVPRIAPPPVLDAFVGRRIARIDVVVEGDRFREAVELRRVRRGEVFTAELARRALLELTDSGRFANATAHAELLGEEVALVLRVLPRRIAASVELSGGVLDEEGTWKAAGLRKGAEITAPGLAAVEQRVRDYYARRGYLGARVRFTTSETDDPLYVDVLAEIDAGPSARIEHMVFEVSPSPRVEGLSEALTGYPLDRGDRIDEELLTQGDRELERRLRARGWHRAEVSHRAELLPRGGVFVRVAVRAGPRLRLRFEGNEQFDASQLESALAIAESEDRSPQSLAERLRDFYVARGFFDVSVRVAERGQPGATLHDLVFTVREGLPVRVVAREYPCLTGRRSAADVGSELDSFLSEELPGGNLLGPVNPRVVDATLGPKAPGGARVMGYEPNPWMTYSEDVYERAMKHVQDLYRSEGYLSATVGPAQLLRRRCDVRSPPGECLPIGPRRRPPTTCLYDEVGLPLEEPAPENSFTCTPDPQHGVYCEPDAVLHIPIKLGPRTYLYDVEFEGNRRFVERELERLTELELGEPVSQTALERAVRHILDAYAEEGYAFAEVDAELEFSPDRTRARVRFMINEREQVRVGSVLIRGAHLTREGLIRSRVALTPGDLFRRSLVRKTEERLATLGVFSSVTVGLDEPYVPAREKVVVVSVTERKPQYLDVRPGFSTGEGFRITFEYGNRNFRGEAIQLTLRVQLGYLPDPLILEDQVRNRLNRELTGAERIERRNTASIEFPEMGLGPLFRLSLEGVDVRDIARDFVLTKDAGIVTLAYRPERKIAVRVGGSLELNRIKLLNDDQDVRERFFAIFKVPDGDSIALAQRVGFTWDRRDNPLEAASGTLLALATEHVTALEANERSLIGDFLHHTGTIAGYLRLGSGGVALASSFSVGYNQQLRDDSSTYPDRLFFLGGIDSVRGFLQDSMVPEDIAQKIERGELRSSEVVIRGGDFYINPRLELRIPLGETLRTALFADAGNLWTDPALADPTELRYAIGTGLRVATPVGPLVFDYGFNVQRLLDALGWSSASGRRPWESLGAFHFSVGLF